jgi:hypothetical protein
MVTLSDGRPRERQGQAEWQKAVELTRDGSSPLAGSCRGRRAMEARRSRAWRRFWLAQRAFCLFLIQAESRLNVTLVTRGRASPVAWEAELSDWEAESVAGAIGWAGQPKEPARQLAEGTGGGAGGGAGGEDRRRWRVSSCRLGPSWYRDAVRRPLRPVQRGGKGGPYSCIRLITKTTILVQMEARPAGRAQGGHRSAGRVPAVRAPAGHRPAVRVPAVRAPAGHRPAVRAPAVRAPGATRVGVIGPGGPGPQTPGSASPGPRIPGRQAANRSSSLLRSAGRSPGSRTRSWSAPAARAM